MTEASATEALRARVQSRMRRAHLARTSIDLQIPLPALQSFAEGTGQLSEAHLHALTKEFFMNTRFDAASDRLINTNLPVKSAAVMPPRWQNPDPAVRAAQAALDAAQAASKAQALPWKPSVPPVGN